MLPIFHGKPSKYLYRHVDELSQVCEINHLQHVPADTMKMKLFPATLRDRTKDWFLKLGKEITSWTEMEEFLRKYYSVGKTTSVRKAIREFTQGSSETFHEAWECPHERLSGTQRHVAEPRGPTRAPAWRGGDTWVLFIFIVVYRFYNIYRSSDYRKTNY